MVSAIAFGFAAAQFRTDNVAAPVLQKRLNYADVEGVVVELELRDRRYRLTLSNLEIAGLGATETPARIRITLAKKFLGSATVGDRIRLRARLLPPPEPMIAGGFDFSRFAFFKRLGAVGFALGRPRLVEQVHTNGYGDRLSIWIAGARQLLGQRIRDAVGDGNAGIAVALMTGDRSGIDLRTWEQLRNSGLAHLMAISGLHMGLIAGWLFFFVRLLLVLPRRVALKRPIKKWAAIVAFLGAFIYLVITGATVPTQRAFVMIAIVLLAIIFDRAPVSMRLVAVAAMVVLLAAPESLLSASFQMSFAAVVALIAIYEAVAPRLGIWRRGAPWWRRGLLYLAGVALTTLVASSATAPFALYLFNQIALLGIAANLIAVPVMAFLVMPSALIAYLMIPFGLEWLPLMIMDLAIDVVMAAAEMVASRPYAVFRYPTPPTIFLVLIVLGGLWLCLWHGRWRYLGMLAIAVGIGSAGAARVPDIFAESSGKLVAVRDPDGGLRLSSNRRSTRVAREWYRKAGLRVPTAGQHRQLRCDTIGCTANVKGRLLVYLFDGQGFEEDCPIADIIVSAIPVRGNCIGPKIVIGRFDLWREGAHAIYLDGEAFRSEAASETRGQRPWVRLRGRRNRSGRSNSAASGR